MNMHYKCVFCQFRMFEDIIEKFPLSDDTKQTIVYQFLEYYGTNENNKSSPEVARDLHAKIRELVNDPDPYKYEKERDNQYLLSLYHSFKNQVQTADNPFETALRLAIAGNIIDFAQGSDYNVMETIEEVLSADFAINHSEQLKEDISNAKTVLYLGDNAGEIVMDKLFIETMNHANVYYAVRGAPIINDVTEQEAYDVGIDKVAHVISNAHDAPSTILDQVSDSFLKIYNTADVIISKGQGNLEGLLGTDKPNLYFLLMVKCSLIGNLLGVKKGNFVVKKNHQ